MASRYRLDPRADTKVLMKVAYIELDPLVLFRSEAWRFIFPQTVGFVAMVIAS